MTLEPTLMVEIDLFDSDSDILRAHFCIQILFCIEEGAQVWNLNSHELQLISAKALKPVFDVPDYKC